MNWMGNVIPFKEVMNRLKNTDDKPYFHSTTVNRLTSKLSSIMPGSFKAVFTSVTSDIEQL